MNTTLYIENITDISSTAKAFVDLFSEEKVVAFVGEMGAGKTTFIKAICQELGVVDTVNSPTFALVNEYHTQKNKSIYHFDLYRIEQAEEVQDMGFEDYLFSGNWCFIEWPEIAEAYLPDNLIIAKIKELENGKRKIEIRETVKN